MQAEKEFFNNITRLDRSSFNILTGLRAGAFVTIILLLAPIVGYEDAAFAALGGMWLTNTEAPKSEMPIRVLLAACFTESIAVGVGTLVGFAGPLVPLIAAVGVFLPMSLHGNPKWTRIGTYTAISFVMGVGLPGSSTSALDRAVFSILGTLWVLLGIWFQRSFVARRKPKEIKRKEQVSEGSHDSLFHPDAVRSALTIGIASGFGFWVGIALGLPRDFWVVVTIILAVQPSLNRTLTFTSGMVLGTIIGALIGVGILLEVRNLYLDVLFLALFAVFMFATKGVNTALTQVFIAPFIIILLDLIYHGHGSFAEARVIDVGIGGLISIATVLVLRLGPVRKYWKIPA